MAQNPYKIHSLQGFFERPDISDAVDDLISLATKAQKNPGAHIQELALPGMESGSFVCMWDGPKETNTDAFKEAVQKYMEWDDSECPWKQK